jgi:hypothetical protein
MINQSYAAVSVVESDRTLGQVEKVEYIEKQIPDYATVGSANTGYVQYYTDEHDVINLDGVVNPELHHAMKRGRWDCYLIRKNISYVIDLAHQIETYMSRVSTDAVRLRSMKMLSTRDQIVVYTVSETNQSKCTDQLGDDRYVSTDE